MKRSSSDTVDENPWTDVQQEPAKKAKPDDVCLIIEPTGDLLEGENGENGHNNSGGNGHHNGDAVAHENNGTQHVEENGQFVQENNGYVAEVEANGSGDENGESSIFETKENGAAATDGTETEEDQPMRADEEEILKSEEIAVEEESIELRISEEQETESNDAVIVSEPIEESTIKLAPSEGTWNQRLICVSELLGHSFKVNAVDMVGNILVSASGDTTIKSWNLETQSEICTLIGHKESVKAVRVLDLAASKDFADDGNVVISGSADCCAKFWHVPSGKELKSIYTFNAINCIGYIPIKALLVTGTEEGKLQLFDAKSGTSLCSILAFELPVISMKVCGDVVFCGDPQGRSRVWIVKERNLHRHQTSVAEESMLDVGSSNESSDDLEFLQPKRKKVRVLPETDSETSDESSMSGENPLEKAFQKEFSSKLYLLASEFPRSADQLNQQVKEGCFDDDQYLSLPGSDLAVLKTPYLSEICGKRTPGEVVALLLVTLLNPNAAVVITRFGSSKGHDYDYPQVKIYKKIVNTVNAVLLEMGEMVQEDGFEGPKEVKKKGRRKKRYHVTDKMGLSVKRYKGEWEKNKLEKSKVDKMIEKSLTNIKNKFKREQKKYFTAAKSDLCFPNCAGF